uniref:MIF4G domain-containing protein n=1 Tax=viral metagenome TaxID=1070528 RepID=A0A6C0IA47_9ZZZZ
MSAIKKLEKTSMSGEGVILPSLLSSILSLRAGVNRSKVPDEILQCVNSIKVRTNNEGWKRVAQSGGMVRPGSQSWRNSGTSLNSINSTNSGGGSGGGFRPNNYSASGSSSGSSSGSTLNNTQSGPPKKYASRFKNSETKVDDKILNTIINGKLNKFSPANYNEIKGFLEQILDSGETSFVKDFMSLVFKKAAAEEIFCPHYARLIAELAKSYESLKTEMAILHKAFLEIFEEVEESECSDYDAFVERNKQKQYRLGYSQFIAELAHREILDSDTIIHTLATLLEQIRIHGKKDGCNKIIEEFCDCILRMSKVFKDCNGVYIIELKQKVVAATLANITEVTSFSTNEYPSISKKAKFSLMDVIDILR